jgi:tight adherence protein C
VRRPRPRGAPEALRRIDDVIDIAATLGAPAAPTLRRLARDLRAAELTRVLAAAERLPAQLALPTTLLLLPATLLLVGAPLVAAGLAAVLT